jgi:TonB family protein
MLKIVIILYTILLLSSCGSTKVTYLPDSCNGIETCSNSIMSRVLFNALWICDQKSDDKIVKINAHIKRDGTIRSAKILKSSGDEEFDSKALEAVQMSAPYWEMAELSEKEFAKAKEINFTFEGNLSN